MAATLDKDASGSGFFNGSASSNDSLYLCAAKSLSGPALPISKDIFIVIRSGLFIYNLVVLVFGLSLNTIIIWIPIKNKKLRTIDMAIAVHIALLNLFRTLLETLPSLVNAAAGVWVFGAISCAVQGAFITTFTLTKRLMMLVLALDRFLLVFHTFTYPKYRARMVIVCSITVWVLSVIMLTPPLPGLLDCYALLPSHISCFVAGSCSHTCSYYSIFIIATTLLPSYIIPVFLFGVLYCKSLRSLSFTAQNTENVKKSIKKANISFFLLFVVYCLITVPSTAGLMITSLVTRFHGPYAHSELALVVATHSTLLLVVLDAIVILRNKDLKEALMKFYKVMYIRLLSLSH